MQVLVVIVLTILVIAIWLGSHGRELLRQRDEIQQIWDKLSQVLLRRHQQVSAWAQTLAAELQGKPELIQPLQKACEQAKSVQSKSPDERLIAENDLSEKLGQFLQNIEKQTGVLESDVYLSLRESAVNLEDEIAALQEHYNDLVVRYNARQHVLPDKFLVDKLKLQKQSEFSLLYPFAEHHLTYKRVMPTARKSIFGLAPEKESTKPVSDG